jgi:hypothetical protein
MVCSQPLVRYHSCFLNRESIGLLHLVEKMLSYALVMQRYTELLAKRLLEEESNSSKRTQSYAQARSDSDLRGKATGASATRPTSGAGEVAPSQLTAIEEKEFAALRANFGQHVSAFLALMTQLAHVASSSASFRLLLTQCNFNRFYRLTTAPAADAAAGTSGASPTGTASHAAKAASV